MRSAPRRRAPAPLARTCGPGFPRSPPPAPPGRVAPRASRPPVGAPRAPRRRGWRPRVGRWPSPRSARSRRSRECWAARTGRPRASARPPAPWAARRGSARASDRPSRSARSSSGPSSSPPPTTSRVASPRVRSSASALSRYAWPFFSASAPTVSRRTGPSWAPCAAAVNTSVSTTFGITRIRARGATLRRWPANSALTGATRSAPLKASRAVSGRLPRIRPAESRCSAR